MDLEVKNNISVVLEQSEVVMSLPKPPGQQWLSILEKLYLLNPKFINRQGKYMVNMSIIILAYTLLSFRYLSGAINPDFAIKIGNYFNVYGKPGRAVTFAAGMYVSSLLYIRIKFSRHQELPFFHEMVAYDDPRQSTWLHDDYKTKVTKFMRKVLFLVKFAADSININLIIGMILLAFISPILIQGVTTENIIFWTLTNILIFFPNYYVAIDPPYIFGSWFLCKCHLDMQVDQMSDQIEEMLASKQQININEIEKLEISYTKLVSRVKTFDNFSRGLISPYRFVTSNLYGIAIFGAHQASHNLVLLIVIDVIATCFYVVSLICLSTGCSLTDRRKRMYNSLNSLFVKMSNQRVKGSSPESLIMLCRIIKSLGHINHPPICLTNSTGTEYGPMEFLHYVLDTFSNFALAANLYHDYAK